MPYRYYHGRTGKIFHVVKRAVGVLINKRVRHRIMTKRIYVRTEHIRKSKCRVNFIKRVKENQGVAQAGAQGAEARVHGDAREGKESDAVEDP